MGGEWFDAKITWYGYEFLETVKGLKSGISKSGAGNAGGAGLSYLVNLQKS